MAEETESLEQLIKENKKEAYIARIFKPTKLTNNVLFLLIEYNPSLEGFSKEQLKQFIKNIYVNENATLIFNYYYFKANPSKTSPVSAQNVKFIENMQNSKENIKKYLITLIRNGYYEKNLYWQQNIIFTYEYAFDIFKAWLEYKKEFYTESIINETMLSSNIINVYKILINYLGYNNNYEIILQCMIELFKMFKMKESALIIQPDTTIDKTTIYGTKIKKQLKELNIYESDESDHEDEIDDYNHNDFYNFNNDDNIPIYIKLCIIVGKLIELGIQYNNPELISLIKKQFPFTKDSAYIQTITHIYNSGYDTDYFKSNSVPLELYKTLGSVNQYLEENYNIEIEKEDVWKHFLKKEIYLGVNLDIFMKSLPELHRFMIERRSMISIKYYWKSSYTNAINEEDIYGLTPIAYGILFKNINALSFIIQTSASATKQKIIGKRRLNLSITVPYGKNGISFIALARYMGYPDILSMMETKQRSIERWKSNSKIGYHQTSKEIADIIQKTSVNEYWFLAGARGMYGAGIYFAETSKETNYKARTKGVVIKAEMYLGNPLELYTIKDRQSFEKEYRIFSLDVDELNYKLQSRGYDSVIAYKDKKDPMGFMKSGNEYMVYSTEQATFLEVQERESSPVQSGGSPINTSMYRFNFKNPWIKIVHNNDVNGLKILRKEALEKRWLLDSTPLMIAAACGNLEMVKCLHIQEPKRLEETDWQNQHALFYAIRGGSIQIIRYLIEANIDLLHQDKNGHFAIEEFSIYQSSFEENDYRKVLLDTLYNILKVSHNSLQKQKTLLAITRLYQCSGRLNDINELERYNALLESFVKIDIPKPSLYIKTASLSQRKMIPLVAGGNK